MEKNKILPNGSAKKVFNKFWKEVKKDTCDRKTLASISFDVGHSLRHQEEENILLKNLEFLTFILGVDGLIGDCKSVYESGSALDKSFELKRKQIKDKIIKFSKNLK